MCNILEELRFPRSIKCQSLKSSVSFPTKDHMSLNTRNVLQTIAPPLSTLIPLLINFTPYIPKKIIC